MSNPTVEAANESTGVEPLNSAPGEPQAQQAPPSLHDNIPEALSSLRAGSEVVVFPADSKDNIGVQYLPDARQFEKIVQQEVRPSGPSRAEEIKPGAWQDEVGEEYAGLATQVCEAVDGGRVKMFKIETGKDKAEFYVVGLDVEGERLLGARITGRQSKVRS